MNLDIQMKLNNNNLYLNYLRSNAYWYKILNRSPERFDEFAEEVKTKYKLRVSDKISSITDNINFVSSMLNTLK